MTEQGKPKLVPDDDEPTTVPADDTTGKPAIKPPDEKARQVEGNDDAGEVDVKVRPGQRGPLNTDARRVRREHGGRLNDRRKAAPGSSPLGVSL